MWPAQPIPGQGLYVALAIALILLAVAAAVRSAFYDRARGKPRCRKCGYPATSDTLDQPARTGCLSSQSKSRESKTKPGLDWSCPECGWSPKRVKDLLRTRRSRKWFTVSVLLLIGAGSSWYAIHVQFRRQMLNESTPTALTPTTWWIAVLPSRSGDEDLIVYHRAYPQGKMSGVNAGQVSMPGSGRAVVSPLHLKANTQRLVADLPGGHSTIPQWQNRWAVAQFERVMQEETEPIKRRCDAAWQYAAFTGLDEDDEVSTLSALLNVRDQDLTVVVLDEFIYRQLSSPLVAAAAARVVEDSIYSSRLRWAAARWLGHRGEYCEPFVLEWIRTDSVDHELVTATIEYANQSPRLEIDETPTYLLRLLKAMFASEYEWHQRDALMLLYFNYEGFWRSRDSSEEMFNTIKPELEAIFRQEARPLRDDLCQDIDLFPGMFQTRDEYDDPRMYEAWAWVLGLHGDDVREDAAYELRHLALDFHNEHQKIEVREMLRTVVETGLQQDQCERVRELLAGTIELLDELEEREARETTPTP